MYLVGEVENGIILIDITRNPKKNLEIYNIERFNFFKFFVKYDVCFKENFYIRIL